MNHHYLAFIVAFLLGKLTTCRLHRNEDYETSYRKDLDPAQRNLNKVDEYGDCGNGVCDEGENCLTCPDDCVNGHTGGSKCGNDICEDGESCFTCPEDCKGGDDEMFCCFGGPKAKGNFFEIKGGISCSDMLCGPETKCSLGELPSVQYCCGDGICSGEETELNCKIDGCGDKCGDNTCDTDEGENAETCPLDCQCNLDSTCDPWETISACPLDCTCGNFVCDVDLGENVANCSHDCSCNANYMCEPWEDANNCPMENCYDYKKDDESNDSEDDDMGDCLSNGETCGEHGQCCSFACDDEVNSCVG